MLNPTSSTKAKMFNTLEVLAVAYAAYRINNGYLKFETYDYHKNIIEKYSNKDYVKGYYNKSVFKHIPIIEITDADREHAAKARSHFNKYTIGILGNSLTDFQQDLFSAVTADEVSFSQLGVLAYVPEMIVREQRESALKKTLKQDFKESKHVGARGETFEGVCRILSKQWFNSFERWGYTVESDGNLLSFFNKFEFQEGETRLIKGKIKDLVNNKKFKVNETRLNYVKLFNVTGKNAKSSTSCN